MSKTLRVINSFFVMEEGDTFVLDADGKFYSSERNEEFHKAGDKNELNSTFSSTFNISVDYAKHLIEEEPTTKPGFVNVFDEIDNLINKYQNDLANIDADMAGEPQCVKVEKTTVLTNIIAVLNHLKTLRK